MKNFAAENATAMRQAKAQSNEVYSKHGKMKMAEGGYSDTDDIQVSGVPYSRSSEESMRKSLLEEMQKMPKRFDGMGATTDRESETLKDLMQKMPKYPRAKKMGSVTETEKSVTVTPAKKRGGRAC